MSTFDGYIREIPGIRVDNFTLTSSVPPPTPDHSNIYFFFLSHVHSDHLKGLNRNDFASTVYCSKITAEVLLNLCSAVDRVKWMEDMDENNKKRDYAHLKRNVQSNRGKSKRDAGEQSENYGCLKPLEVGTRHMLDLRHSGKDQKLCVTLIDANHCLGAVMYASLYAQQSSPVIHEGDFRGEAHWINSLSRNPVLSSYVNPPNDLEKLNLLGVGCSKRLDNIYLDTSGVLCTTDLVEKDKAVKDLVKLMKLFPAKTKFFLNAWTWGYEDMLIEVSKAFSSPIHLDPYKHLIYTLPSVLRTHPSLSLLSSLKFCCRNPKRLHPSCHCPKTRFHACERRWKCEDIRDKEGRGDFVVAEEFREVLMSKKREKMRKGMGVEKKEEEEDELVVWVSPWDRSQEYWEREVEEVRVFLEKCQEAETDGEKFVNWPKHLVRLFCFSKTLYLTLLISTAQVVPLSRHSTLPELQSFVSLFKPSNLYPNTLIPSLRGSDYLLLPSLFSSSLPPSSLQNLRSTARSHYLHIRGKLGTILSEESWNKIEKRVMEREVKMIEDPGRLADDRYAADNTEGMAGELSKLIRAPSPKMKQKGEKREKGRGVEKVEVAGRNGEETFLEVEITGVHKQLPATPKDCEVSVIAGENGNLVVLMKDQTGQVRKVELDEDVVGKLWSLDSSSGSEPNQATALVPNQNLGLEDRSEDLGIENVGNGGIDSQEESEEEPKSPQFGNYRQTLSQSQTPPSHAKIISNKHLTQEPFSPMAVSPRRSIRLHAMTEGSPSMNDPQTRELWSNQLMESNIRILSATAHYRRLNSGSPQPTMPKLVTPGKRKRGSELLSGSPIRKKNKGLTTPSKILEQLEKNHFPRVESRGRRLPSPSQSIENSEDDEILPLKVEKRRKVDQESVEPNGSTNKRSPPRLRQNPLTVETQVAGGSKTTPSINNKTPSRAKNFEPHPLSPIQENQPSQSQSRVIMVDGLPEFIDSTPKHKIVRQYVASGKKKERISPRSRLFSLASPSPAMSSSKHPNMQSLIPDRQATDPSLSSPDSPTRQSSQIRPTRKEAAVNSPVNRKPRAPSTRRKMIAQLQKSFNAKEITSEDLVRFGVVKLADSSSQEDPVALRQTESELLAGKKLVFKGNYRGYSEKV